MSTDKLNTISGDLYNLLLQIHKNILNPSEMTKNAPIPQSHVRVIIYLKRCGSSSISEIAKNLMISKPNMTPIIDKLICEGMVNRYDDPNDRRILRIELTDKAHEFIKNREEIIKNDLAKKISTLKSEDLESLNHHIAGIRNIILKLEKD